jgi:hypothetical protein
MGLRLTHTDESHRLRHPHAKLALSLPKGGGPRHNNGLDSRSPAFAEDKFRGNDEPGSDFQGSDMRNVAAETQDLRLKQSPEELFQGFASKYRSVFRGSR